MKYLFENGNFYIQLVQFKDPSIDEVVTGYGLYNKRTDVREFESRRLDFAIRVANAIEREIQSDPTPPYQHALDFTIPEGRKPS